MHSRRIVLALTIAASLWPIVACVPLGDGVIPAPSFPELAGSWRQAGTNGAPLAGSGCYVLDAAGQPEALNGFDFVRGIIGVNSLAFDETWRTASFHGIPVQYMGTGQTTQSSGTYTIEMTCSVSGFGVTFTYTSIMTGTVEEGALHVHVTEYTNAPLRLIGLPSAQIEDDIVLVRAACP